MDPVTDDITTHPQARMNDSALIQRSRYTAITK